MTPYKRKSCQLHRNAFFSTLFILVLAFLPTSKAYSESADELMALAKGYILTHLDPQLKQPQISISPLSSAAQKPSCEKSPQITYNTKQRVGNLTLTISCVQPAWRQYVNAKVTGLLPVIVTVQDLSAGQPVHERLVAIDWRPNAQVTNNHLRDLTSVQHKSVRQFIAKGAPLQQHHIKDTILIQKNDWVKIVSADPRFHIEMNGMALEAGSMGQAIRVKNLSSGKTVKAYIESADTVSVR
jgi:flagella basal body P-ring formation protein FlgA